MASQQDSQSQQRLAEQAALVAVYMQQSHGIRQALLEFIERLWASLGVYRSPRRFVSEVVPAVTGAQQQMAALTSAYLARQRQIMAAGNGAPRAVSDLDVTGAATRNGVPLTDVYERPFHTVWRELADLPHEDGAIDLAIGAGLEQAQTQAATDLQRTKTLTSQQIIDSTPGIVGYARILEGEFSCGLCIVASTLRYTRGELMPIHPGCDCGEAPIFGDEDPGLVINEQRLADIHDAIAKQFGRHNAGARIIDGQVKVNGKPLEYRDVIVTHEHGELGPIMAVRGQQFTGPGDLQ